ncbi:hypothetical protein H5410_030199 [Solanum commersonii]|uniref:Uncharacterized protein n=1 Tax=Solanum commersonii TaxID=4109 RepID=A0A9J5YFG0_SOLCO|nr:hypothetical protein H5410_030199 [Solanum commersonii]
MGHNPHEKSYNFSKINIKQIISVEDWEFSILWIHKWTPEIRFTEEDIPCLYRTYYNNSWDKLMK